MLHNINVTDSKYYHPEEAELDLNSQALTNQDIQELILPFLDAHPEIKVLNVSHNHIGNEGAKMLAKNLTLTSLNIGNNWIGDPGIRALAENKMFVSLAAYYNSFGEDGVIALAENTTLQKLKLSADCFGTKGAKALASNSSFSLEIIGKPNGGLKNKEVMEIAAIFAETAAITPFSDHVRTIVSNSISKISMFSQLDASEAGGNPLTPLQTSLLKGFVGFRN